MDRGGALPWEKRRKGERKTRKGNHASSSFRPPGRRATVQIPLLLLEAWGDVMRDSDVIRHIEELCQERSWSHYRLAKESDIPYSTINNMVRRTNIPTVPTLQKMCDAFGITLADFFSEEQEKTELTKWQTELLDICEGLSRDDRRLLLAYGKGLAKILR